MLLAGLQRRVTTALRPDSQDDVGSSDLEEKTENTWSIEKEFYLPYFYLFIILSIFSVFLQSPFISILLSFFHMSIFPSFYSSIHPHTILLSFPLSTFPTFQLFLPFFP